jgi:hypothetical protein
MQPLSPPGSCRTAWLLGEGSIAGIDVEESGSIPIGRRSVTPRRLTSHQMTAPSRLSIYEVMNSCLSNSEWLVMIKNCMIPWGESKVSLAVALNSEVFLKNIHGIHSAAITELCANEQTHQDSRHKPNIYTAHSIGNQQGGKR